MHQSYHGCRLDNVDVIGNSELESAHRMSRHVAPTELALCFDKGLGINMIESTYLNQFNVMMKISW